MFLNAFVCMNWLYCCQTEELFFTNQKSLHYYYYWSYQLLNYLKSINTHIHRFNTLWVIIGMNTFEFEIMDTCLILLPFLPMVAVPKPVLSSFIGSLRTCLPYRGWKGRLFFGTASCIRIFFERSERHFAGRGVAKLVM